MSFPTDNSTPAAQNRVEVCDSATLVRALVQISGNVQGVGFRPFIFQLASEFGLRGRVANNSSGVELEAEGPRDLVAAFLAEIPRRQPPRAVINEWQQHWEQPAGYATFSIEESRRDGNATALISPDISVCDDCLRELFDFRDRRYRYPFINCTNCGPRYTIIHDVPYDRAATAMDCFQMCAACQAEFDDPNNRRFHAQPNACAQCGPHVWLIDRSLLTATASRQEKANRPAADMPDQSLAAIERAVQLLREGQILAVKGLGGFHLACDATNQEAVAAMRSRKDREEKPLALMVPDVETARRLCHLDTHAEKLLCSPQRPIVLLPRRETAAIADAVAPRNEFLGMMLPYTPLHYLLMFESAGLPRFSALVMTSGNRKDEPLAISNHDAITDLQEIADAFLLHNRDICIRADDSVVRPQRGSQHQFIRRSRGYVPAPLFVGQDVGEILAVGGHLKNTIAVSRGNTVFLSQHIGDLESLAALDYLEQSIEHLQRLLRVHPNIVAHDLHPDYLSTRFALRLKVDHYVPVQHHHAHIASCMAEHGLANPVIGIALDGTGYGTDGSAWGGEFLIADYRGFQRRAHFQTLPMPGNEQAVKQPWRMAISYLDTVYGDELWNLPISFCRNLDQPAQLVLRAAHRGVNSPLTSSCGRLFDAIAALLGIRQMISYEGQAAIELEMALEGYQANIQENVYPAAQLVEQDLNLASHPVSQSLANSEKPFVIDWQPLIRAIVVDITAGIPVGEISYRFHRWLVNTLTIATQLISEESGIRQIVLSGGCFQNRFVQERLRDELEAIGLEVFTHHQVPTNDGGIALGQLMIAAATFKKA